MICKWLASYVLMTPRVDLGFIGGLSDGKICSGEKNYASVLMQRSLYGFCFKNTYDNSTHLLILWWVPSHIALPRYLHILHWISLEVLLLIYYHYHLHQMCLFYFFSTHQYNNPPPPDLSFTSQLFLRFVVWSLCIRWTKIDLLLCSWTIDH